MQCLRNRVLISTINSQVLKLCSQEAVLLLNRPELRLIPTPNLQIYRMKSKKSKKKQQVDETGTETEEEEKKILDDLVPDKTSKIMLNVQVPSMRVDALLKVGMGIARAKVDELFYEDKLRINGKKVFKKAQSCEEGDEIDIIREVNPNNPNLLTVSRVEILTVKPKSDGFAVSVRRNKNLLVENYELHDISGN